MEGLIFYMLKRLNNNEGFTLLEVILSIAIVAILSGFILQMFIVAADANTKAQNIDIASAKAANVIEQIKACESFEAMKASEVMQSFTKNENAFYRVYDRDWNETKNFDAEELYGTKVAEQESSAEDHRYLMKLEIYSGQDTNPAEASDEIQYGKLVDINIRILDLAGDEAEKTIVNYSSSKYFTANS